MGERHEAEGSCADAGHRDGSGCTSDTEVLLTGGSLFRFEDASCTTEPPAPPEPVPWGAVLPLLA